MWSIPNRASKVLNLEVPDESTVVEAIERSGILKQFPHVALAERKLGIFGRVVKPDAVLKAGDRWKSTGPSSPTLKPCRAATRAGRMIGITRIHGRKCLGYTAGLGKLFWPPVLGAARKTLWRCDAALSVG